MVNILVFTTAIISAIIAYFAATVFILSYAKEQKSNRLIWGIAFILYAIGHTIMAVISMVTLSESDYLLAMWVYVNLGGAGTTGLVLYSTFPFVTEKPYVREVITAIWIGLYIIGSALLAFVLPAENPMAIVNPTAHSQLANMSWWIVELLIPASFFIGLIFLKHFKESSSQWALFIGLSFVIYAIILFFWPIPAMKPLFYVVRTISVGLLGIGGFILAKE